MSRVLYTSDPHFAHERVSGIRGFATTAEHDDHLIQRMRSQLKPRDILYIVGDLTVSKEEYALELVASLPGTKHLISGNHDRTHPMHRSANGVTLRRYLEVFETVTPFARRKTQEVEFAISHFPYASFGDGEHREGSRYNQWRLPDTGYPLVHGHTHGTEKAHGNMFHVGWDAWGGLVAEDLIIDWVKALPK